VRRVVDIGLQDIVHDRSRQIKIASEISDTHPHRLWQQRAVPVRRRPQDRFVDRTVGLVNCTIVRLVGIVNSLGHLRLAASGQHSNQCGNKSEFRGRL